MEENTSNTSKKLIKCWILSELVIRQEQGLGKLAQSPSNKLSII